MIKIIGIALIILSALAWDRTQSLDAALWFLFGLYLVGSKLIFNLFMLLERQKPDVQHWRRRC